MAKLVCPLLSFNAHGTLGKILTFCKRVSGNQTRFQRKQKDVSTALRDTQRSHFEEAYGKWNTLTGNQKQQWNDFVADP